MVSFSVSPFEELVDFWIGKSDNSCPKPIGSCFKAQARTGRRLKEKGCYNFFCQKTAVWFLFKLSCHFQKVHNSFFGVIGNRN